MHKQARLTGIVSAATLRSVYASSFVNLPTWSGKVLILLLLGTITLTEISGLIWAITSNSGSMIAVINGTLVQIIMALRVIYGMSTMQSAHKLFSYIHPNTQTPIPAIMFIVLTILAYTLCLPLLTLAKITSFLILIIFLLLNLSLLKFKLDHRLTKTTIRLPAWMPAASASLCLLLPLSQLTLF